MPAIFQVKLRRRKTASNAKSFRKTSPSIQHGVWCGSRYFL